MAESANTDAGEPERRAAAFRRARAAHAAEAAEDYVELIADLIAEAGAARLTDVAGHMGVSAATAAKVVQRLAREGLIDTRPYKSLRLTPAGSAMAERARARHEVVRDFLLALGVDRRTAELDSEGMEHHVSDETLGLLRRFTEERSRLDQDLAKAKS